MDRETLNQAIAEGPIVIGMNDGKQFTVASREMIIVDDIAAYVLCREADGKLRAKILALVCMCSIEPVAA
ncbi:hypothetical protein Pla175_44810 [Pirellulimonas nuda]|uniref:Uncharacterized protein n=1 Tax=Pirellulimonas nuda TaxID=2528009 RepID=A0A518DHX6_9BACT|nr:hypothetical protein [Pirellulimonas nuda]QDU91064.1 hypothetical protein Pla175_44810 [Pirellulimonas nuda]